MSAKTTKNVIFPLFFTGETPPVAILSGAVEKRRTRSAPTGAPPLTKGTVHIPFIIGKKRGKVKYSGEGASGLEPVFRQRDEATSPLPAPSGRQAVPVLPAGDPGGVQGRWLSLLAPSAKARLQRPFPLRQKYGGPGHTGSLSTSTAERVCALSRQKAPLAAMEATSRRWRPESPFILPAWDVRREHAAARPQPLFLTPSVQKEQTPVRRLLLGRGEFTSPPSSLFRQPFAPAAFPARRCGSPGRGWRWRSPALPAAGRWGRCGCWRHRGPCRRGRWRPPGSV